MRDLDFFTNGSEADIAVCENYANMGYLSQDASVDLTSDVPSSIDVPYGYDSSYGGGGYYASYGYSQPSYYPSFYTQPAYIQPYPGGYPGYAGQVASQPCPDGTWPSHDNSGALVCPSGPMPPAYGYGYPYGGGGVQTQCPAGQQWVYNPAVGTYVCSPITTPVGGVTPCAVGYVYTPGYGCLPQSLGSQQTCPSGQVAQYNPSTGQWYCSGIAGGFMPPLSNLTPQYPVGTLGGDAAAEQVITAALQGGQITIKACGKRRLPAGQSQYRNCRFQVAGSRKLYNFTQLYRMLASSGMVSPGASVAGAAYGQIPSVTTF